MENQRLTTDQFLKYALLFGVVQIVYQLFAYLMGIGYMASLWNVGFSILLNIAVLVYIMLQIRNVSGGFISFRKLFVNTSIVLIFGLFLSVMFDYVLNTVIDPDLPLKIVEASFENTLSMLEGMGLPDETLDETYAEMEQAKKEIESEYTVAQFLPAYLISYGLWTIPNLILSLILKKEESLFKPE
tara:strand:- start:1043 stop:1600 length:558 start_codon:yes stop_codon:yes gene_type:complete